MRNLEHALQKSCVRWFDLQYPKHRLSLFAVPNGGMRNKTTAGKLKAEGVRSGVSDLCLLANGTIVFIEMKIPGNTTTDTQKEFGYHVSKNGYPYHVIFDYDQFRKLIIQYLGDPSFDKSLKHQV